MHTSLRSYVDCLEHAGELRRIGGPFSPVLEIAAIADRASKSPAPNLPHPRTRAFDPGFHHLGGPALFFENVPGSDFPVLINAFGSYRRMEIALGCNAEGPGLGAGHTPGGLEALAERLGQLIKPEPPPTLLAKLKKLPELVQLARTPPKRVRHGPCQEVVRLGEAIDLRRLPILRCWPLDGDLGAVGWPANANAGIEGAGSGPEWDRNFRGRYITLGGVHTIHADDSDHPAPPSRNIGMYRAQLLGPRLLAMHWHVHHDGARHWRSWKRAGKPMPVAIALGGESVLPYAATAPMPPGISELLLAGFLNRGPIPMVRCRTVPLDVPANAEIVIEGFVSTEAGEIGHAPTDPPGPGAAIEGPFGDHTGFYSLPDRYPLFRVTAITHRRDAIYPTTIVGLPPQEDYFLGKTTERLFLPLLRTIVPDIVDYDLPMFGAFHNAAFIAIRKEYPLQARRVMHAIWGAGQMSWTKTIVVVDDDVDVHDRDAVLRAVGEFCLPARDIELSRGPLDILDHAAPFLGSGTKLGLDATRKRGDAETHRFLEGLAAELCAAGPIPRVADADARAIEMIVRGLPGVLDARVPDALGGWWILVRAAAGIDGTAVIKSLGGTPNHGVLPRYAIVLGPDAALADLGGALFHWMANVSHDRDRVTSVCGRRVVFDATPKRPGVGGFGLPIRPWPPLIVMDPAVLSSVGARIRLDPVS